VRASKALNLSSDVPAEEAGHASGLATRPRGGGRPMACAKAT